VETSLTKDIKSPKIGAFCTCAAADCNSINVTAAGIVVEQREDAELEIEALLCSGTCDRDNDRD